MADERDIWASAKLLVDRHGNGANRHATQRATELLEQGDLEGAAVWWRIVSTIDDILRTEPKDGEPSH